MYQPNLPFEITEKQRYEQLELFVRDFYIKVNSMEHGAADLKADPQFINIVKEFMDRYVTIDANHIQTLSNEIILSIFDYLTTRDVFDFIFTCSKYLHFLSNKDLWMKRFRRWIFYDIVQYIRVTPYYCEIEKTVNEYGLTFGVDWKDLCKAIVCGVTLNSGRFSANCGTKYSKMPKGFILSMEYFYIGQVPSLFEPAYGVERQFNKFTVYGDLTRGKLKTNTVTILYNGGDKYIGSFKKPYSKHGYGTYYYSDGSSYEGGWKNDNKCGHGCYRHADYIQKGKWNTGSLRKGQIIFPNGIEMHFKTTDRSFDKYVTGIVSIYYRNKLLLLNSEFLNGLAKSTPDRYYPPELLSNVRKKCSRPMTKQLECFFQPLYGSSRFYCEYCIVNCYVSSMDGLYNRYNSWMNMRYLTHCECPLTHE